MSLPPFSIRCPACAAHLSADTVVTDGGRAEMGDVLYGEPVTCTHCDAEFEVLFYP